MKEENFEYPMTLASVGPKHLAYLHPRNRREACSTKGSLEVGRQKTQRGTEGHSPPRMTIYL